MRVSSDLIFLGKDKKVVIYNYFINRAIMVNKDSAHFIKYNMGKCIETNMIVDENLKILKKNGVIIENEKEYKEKILKLLVDVKNDNPKRFGDKINMLIERTV